MIAAPPIAECPVNLECRLLHTANLGSHDWFIGEVVAARADADLVDTQGRVDSEKLSGVFSWRGRYCAPGQKLQKWGFAGGQ